MVIVKLTVMEMAYQTLKLVHSLLLYSTCHKFLTEFRRNPRKSVAEFRRNPRKSVAEFLECPLGKPRQDCGKPRHDFGNLRHAFGT